MIRTVPLLALAAVAATAVSASDAVDRRVTVPDPGRPHGEVRIVRRDGATVVQTLVHSRAMRRVAGTIAEKERSNWPAGAEGSADAARYVRALADVAAAVRRAGAADAERRQSLCIEFPAVGPVTVAAARVAAGDDGLRLLETTEPRVALDVSDWYLRRNRALIVADAFGVDEATAAAWLEAPGKGVAAP